MLTGVTILGIGGAHVDRRGQTFASFLAGASNPGRMREETGGGTFNALRCAKQLGAACRLISVRGADAAGDAVAQAVREAGIDDLSSTFLDRATPTYTALVDRDGEVVAALADMELYEVGFPREIRRAKLRDAVKAADAVLCDANLPEASLARLPRLIGGRPLHAVAISPAKAVRLGPILPALACLYLNRREAAALTDKAGASRLDLIPALRERGLACGVLTEGGEALLAFEGGTVLSLVPPAPRSIADSTGAGDALAGAMTALLAGGASLGDALRHGAAAALLAIESASCAPAFSPATFAEALALVPQPLPVA